MQNKRVIKFFLRATLFASPILILVGMYLAMDPFKVLYSYDRYLENGKGNVVALNKGYISTQTFLRYHPEQDYNSFIFGSSRTLFYRVEEWKKHLPENTRPFHFDGSADGLCAIAKKVELLQRKGASLEDVLLVMDEETLRQTKVPSGHIFAMHPSLDPEAGRMNFHSEFLKTYFSPRFLFALLDYKWNGELKPYMKEHKLLLENELSYEPLTNEVRFEGNDRLLEEGKYYTEERMKVFTPRPELEEIGDTLIGDEQLELLKTIHKIFVKNNTNYRVVISPLYNQVKLNPYDLKQLKTIFGRETVFDFSGKNEITEDYQNYYENSHYLPQICNQIMDSIYSVK